MSELAAPAAPIAIAAHPTVAVRVTLFEDRAEVVRSARAQIPAGVGWVGFGGVSPLVDERTVQARVVGGKEAGARVIAARVLWRVHHEGALGREDIEALEREVRDARAREAAALCALDRATRDGARAGQLLGHWAAAVGGVPRDAREPEALARWRASYAALEEAASRALAAEAEAREERVRAHDELLRCSRRLAEGTSAAPRHEAIIEVELEATAAGEREIELTYRCACALWRPEHLIRLVTNGAKIDGREASLEIVTLATVWQRTGELWGDVQARFSTARPARAASPPTLSDDVLLARRKTDAERHRIQVEARDQAIALAGVDGGARVVEEMPGVDDGGEPLVLEAKERVTMVSDGRPLRVEVARATVPARVARVLYPERAPVAHLRATATLGEGVPLLAGPVRVARGASLVGRSRIGYVGKGEPFEIGFGADDGVRVRRTEDEERDTAAILGTQRIKRTVKVHLSNLSADPSRVLVTERVPVSEIAEIEIHLDREATSPGFRLDPKDGFAVVTVDLGANATETLTLAYEIKAAAKVVLPF